jgi:hypothetical protein
MSSSKSEASESTADRIRRNDYFLTNVHIIMEWESAVCVEILDALKNNSLVRESLSIAYCYRRTKKRL